MPVTINALELENVKRIKAVALEPSPTGLTIIGGNNRQGKTSVLDAICWALGGDRYKPSQPTREGSEIPPHLKLTLSNGLIVERSGKNSALKVVDPNGRKGGQQLLNEFVEQFALDLPAFMEMNDKKKADVLLRIIGVGEQLYAMEQNEQRLYNRRTEIGKCSQVPGQKHDCMFWHSSVGCCDYLCITGKRRPCPASACTVYKKGHHPNPGGIDENRDLIF